MSMRKQDVRQRNAMTLKEVTQVEKRRNGATRLCFLLAISSARF
jgi:hypothetical protein